MVDLAILSLSIVSYLDGQNLERNLYDWHLLNYFCSLLQTHYHVNILFLGCIVNLVVWSCQYFYI
jgi:hypothetical protein